MPDHDPTRRYLCRHVHTNGHRCGSPALRAQNFCYYHDRTRLPNAPLAGRIGIFKMQPIDDRAAIQIALYDVLSRITAGDIDTKRASTLLYGLQIASSNLARLEKLQPATEPIEDITFHDTLGDLAPITEIPDQSATSFEAVIPSIPTNPVTPSTPLNSVILSERSESKDPRISAPTTFETVILSERSESKAPRISAPTTFETVILSEARSAQSKDPRICTPTTPKSTPTPSTLPTPVILSERSESKDPRISAPTTAKSAPPPEARTGSPASVLAGVGSAQSKDPRISAPPPPNQRPPIPSRLLITPTFPAPLLSIP